MRGTLGEIDVGDPAASTSSCSPAGPPETTRSSTTTRSGTRCGPSSPPGARRRTPWRLSASASARPARPSTRSRPLRDATDALRSDSLCTLTRMGQYVAVAGSGSERGVLRSRPHADRRVVGVRARHGGAQDEDDADPRAAARRGHGGDLQVPRRPRHRRRDNARDRVLGLHRRSAPGRPRRAQRARAAGPARQDPARGAPAGRHAPSRRDAPPTSSPPRRRRSSSRSPHRSA